MAFQISLSEFPFIFPSSSPPIPLLSCSYFEGFFLLEPYFFFTIDFSYAVSLSKRVFFCPFNIHFAFTSLLDILFFGMSSLGISDITLLDFVFVSSTRSEAL